MARELISSQEADLRALPSVLPPALGRRHTPATVPTHLTTPFLNTHPPNAQIWQQAQIKIFKNGNINPKFPAESCSGLIGAEAEPLISQMKGTISSAQSCADSHPAHSGYAELSFLCSSSTVHHERKSPALLPAHTLCNI